MQSVRVRAAPFRVAAAGRTWTMLGGSINPKPHPALPTPESSSRLFSPKFGDTSGSSPLLLPSPCVTGSALSCSPCGANMSVLQVSLYVTGCCFAPSSRRVTTLRHNQSPDCIAAGPAIWRPDPYQNWTFTSEQTMIYQDTPTLCSAAFYLITAPLL